MSARDDYPMLALLTQVEFATQRHLNERDRAFSEIDELRSINEDGKRAYARLLVRYDEQEAYLADVARQLADCLVRGR